MQKTELFLQGKAKDLWLTDDPAILQVCFKDACSAYNGLIRGEVRGKGAVNNRVCAYLMRRLEENGIATQLIGEADETSSFIRRLDMLPLEVITRNVSAGSLIQRIGVAEGTKLPVPVQEFFFKSNELDDPMVNSYHIASMHWATRDEVIQMEQIALKANEVLSAAFAAVDIELVDFKLEFGRDADGSLVVANELNLDTCRLWDLRKKERVDRDCFAVSADLAEEAYRTVSERLLGK